ncbi:MAG: peroxidase-related enzyme [Acidobacteriia bacterium]|nr:peroxidase-related enzyme [Terriglobia bacterium]
MAWIKTITPEEAQGDLKKEYDTAMDFWGYVPHLWSVQGLNPEVMHATMNLHKAIMLGPSSLSRQEREMIAVVVARTLGSKYCTDVHGENLRALSHDDRFVRLIKIDYRMLLLEDRARAMLDFAARLTKDPHSADPEAIQELHDKGLTDEDILNLVQVTGFQNYMVRLANSLGVEPDNHEPAPMVSKSSAKAMESLRKS